MWLAFTGVSEFRASHLQRPKFKSGGHIRSYPSRKVPLKVRLNHWNETLVKHPLYSPQQLQPHAFSSALKPHTAPKPRIHTAGAELPCDLRPAVLAPGWAVSRLSLGPRARKGIARPSASMGRLTAPASSVPSRSGRRGRLLSAARGTRENPPSGELGDETLYIPP